MVGQLVVEVVVLSGVVQERLAGSSLKATEVAIDLPLLNVSLLSLFFPCLWPFFLLVENIVFVMFFLLAYGIRSGDYLRRFGQRGRAVQKCTS